jgi:hypothetical protein
VLRPFDARLSGNGLFVGSMLSFLADFMVMQTIAQKVQHIGANDCTKN